MKTETITETGHCVFQTIDGKKQKVQAPDLTLFPAGFSLDEGRKLIKSTRAAVKSLGLKHIGREDFVCFVSAGGELVYLEVGSV